MGKSDGKFESDPSIFLVFVLAHFAPLDWHLADRRALRRLSSMNVVRKTVLWLRTVCRVQSSKLAGMREGFQEKTSDRVPIMTAIAKHCVVVSEVAD